MLEAAEKRERDNMNRGIGDSKRAQELAERAEKEEMIGRIREVCIRSGAPIPLQLGLMSVAQLKQLYRDISVLQ